MGCGSGEVTDDLGESHAHGGKNLIRESSRAQGRRGSGDNILLFKELCGNGEQRRDTFPHMLATGNDEAGTWDGCQRKGR